MRQVNVPKLFSLWDAENKLDVVESSVLGTY